MADAVTPLLLAGEVMLASLALALVLLFCLHRSRQQTKVLRQQLEGRAGSVSVEQFLRRESDATRRLLRSGDGRQRLLATLRKRWLQAELQGLVQQGAAVSDLRRLQESLAALLTLLERNRQVIGFDELESRLRQEQEQVDQLLRQVSELNPEQIAATDAELAKARSTIDVQRKTIQDLRNLVALYRERTRGKTTTEVNEAQVVNFENHLSSVEENSDAIHDSVAKLEQALRETRANYRDACEQIKALQKQVQRDKARVVTDATVLVVERNKQQKDALASTRDFLAEMEASYQQSAGELGRLQDTNRRQRELILEMEKELSLLRKDAVQYEASQELLDKLKLQLRDYEMCTITLEAETESLRERLQTLNRIIEQVEAGTGGEVLDQLQTEIADVVELRRESQRRQQIVDMLQHVAAAAHPEQAAAQLLALLRDWQLEAVLFIKGAESQLWLSTSGAVDRRDKQMLQSLALQPGQPWLDTKDGIFVLHATCRLLLRGKVLSGNERESMQATLLGLLAAFDGIITYMLRPQNGQRIHQITQQFRELRKPLASVDVQNRYLLEESARVLDSFRGELMRYISTIETTPIQRQLLEDMFKDFEARMGMLSNANGAAQRGLRQVMEGLDKLSVEN